MFFKINQPKTYLLKSRCYMKKVKIYTDGSTVKNPGPGGWAAVFVLESGNYKVISEPSHIKTVTNNIMELMGPIRALEALPRACSVTIYSDSQYVVKGATTWLRGWIDKNWVGVKNIEYWKRLIVAMERHEVSWQWIKGHNGNHFNEIADKAAYDAARSITWEDD
jgi:ribonuclease HI